MPFNGNNCGKKKKYEYPDSYRMPDTCRIGT